MERISSSFTFVSKWVFPVAWGGSLFFIIGVVVSDRPFFLLVPVLMLLIGFFIMKQFFWELADVVYDHGAYLLVRRNGIEARIMFSNIMNVSSSTFVKPPWVTIRLVEPCALGVNISFLPKSSFSLNPFAKNEVAESLIERAFSARTKNIP